MAVTGGAVVRSPLPDAPVGESAAVVLRVEFEDRVLERVPLSFNDANIFGCFAEAGAWLLAFRVSPQRLALLPVTDSPTWFGVPPLMRRGALPGGSLRADPAGPGTGQKRSCLAGCSGACV